MFPEMDKIRKDIECIREKEEPESCKDPVPRASESHGESCKNIRDHRKDQIPDESEIDRRLRQIDMDHREYPSEETEERKCTDMVRRKHIPSIGKYGEKTMKNREFHRKILHKI
jgi:hypothetical protein